MNRKANRKNTRKSRRMNRKSRRATRRMQRKSNKMYGGFFFQDPGFAPRPTGVLGPAPAQVQQSGVPGAPAPGTRGGDTLESGGNANSPKPSPARAPPVNRRGSGSSSITPGNFS